jgi:hypothetical protein
MKDYRPPVSSKCPKAYVQLMTRCLDADPGLRPSFLPGQHNIVEELEFLIAMTTTASLCHVTTNSEKIAGKEGRAGTQTPGITPSTEEMRNAARNLGAERCGRCRGQEEQVEEKLARIQSQLESTESHYIFHGLRFKTGPKARLQGGAHLPSVPVC